MKLKIPFAFLAAGENHGYVLLINHGLSTKTLFEEGGGTILLGPKFFSFPETSFMEENFCAVWL